MLLARISHFLMDIYSLKQSLITFAICIWWFGEKLNSALDYQGLLDIVQ